MAVDAPSTHEEVEMDGCSPGMICATSATAEPSIQGGSRSSSCCCTDTWRAALDATSKDAEVAAPVTGYAARHIWAGAETKSGTYAGKTTHDGIAELHSPMVVCVAAINPNTTSNLQVKIATTRTDSQVLQPKFGPPKKALLSRYRSTQDVSSGTQQGEKAVKFDPQGLVAEFTAIPGAHYGFQSPPHTGPTVAQHEDAMTITHESNPEPICASRDCHKDMGAFPALSGGCCTAVADDVMLQSVPTMSGKPSLAPSMEHSAMLHVSHDSCAEVQIHLSGCPAHTTAEPGSPKSRTGCTVPSSSMLPGSNQQEAAAVPRLPVHVHITAVEDLPPHISHKLPNIHSLLPNSITESPSPAGLHDRLDHCVSSHGPQAASGTLLNEQQPPYPSTPPRQPQSLLPPQPSMLVTYHHQQLLHMPKRVHHQPRTTSSLFIAHQQHLHAKSILMKRMAKPYLPALCRSAWHASVPVSSTSRLHHVMHSQQMDTGTCPTATSCAAIEAPAAASMVHTAGPQSNHQNDTCSPAGPRTCNDSVDLNSSDQGCADHKSEDTGRVHRLVQHQLQYIKAWRSSRGLPVGAQHVPAAETDVPQQPAQPACVMAPRATPKPLLASTAALLHQTALSSMLFPPSSAAVRSPPGSSFAGMLMKRAWPFSTNQMTPEPRPTALMGPTIPDLHDAKRRCLDISAVLSARLSCQRTCRLPISIATTLDTRQAAAHAVDASPADKEPTKGPPCSAHDSTTVAHADAHLVPTGIDVASAISERMMLAGAQQCDSGACPQSAADAHANTNGPEMQEDMSEAPVPDDANTKHASTEQVAPSLLRKDAKSPDGCSTQHVINSNATVMNEQHHEKLELEPLNKMPSAPGVGDYPIESDDTPLIPAVHFAPSANPDLGRMLDNVTNDSRKGADTQPAGRHHTGEGCARKTTVSATDFNWLGSAFKPWPLSTSAAMPQRSPGQQSQLPLTSGMDATAHIHSRPLLSQSLLAPRASPTQMAANIIAPSPVRFSALRQGRMARAGGQVTNLSIASTYTQHADREGTAQQSGTPKAAPSLTSQIAASLLARSGQSRSDNSGVNSKQQWLRPMAIGVLDDSPKIEPSIVSKIAQVLLTKTARSTDHLASCSQLVQCRQEDSKNTAVGEKTVKPLAHMSDAITHALFTKRVSAKLCVHSSSSGGATNSVTRHPTLHPRPQADTHDHLCPQLSSKPSEALPVSTQVGTWPNRQSETPPAPQSITSQIAAALLANGMRSTLMPAALLADHNQSSPQPDACHPTVTDGMGIGQSIATQITAAILAKSQAVGSSTGNYTG